MNKSLSCLRGSIRDLRNTYTTALLAYTFTLAGDMDNRNILLNHLDTIAINKGESSTQSNSVSSPLNVAQLVLDFGFAEHELHWDQTPKKSASLSVEISSYMIQVLLGSPRYGDRKYTTCFVRWLITQQNYYGCFSSTKVWKMHY